MCIEIQALKLVMRPHQIVNNYATVVLHVIVQITYKVVFLQFCFETRRNIGYMTMMNCPFMEAFALDEDISPSCLGLRLQGWSSI
jgi:hypothetical protein